MRIFIRSLMALLAGYAVITVITIVAFPLVLGHALVQKDVPREVFLGTLIAVAAGLAGGYVGTVIGVLRPVLSAALVAIPVAAESTYLLLLRTKPDDLLFSALGAVVLLASIVAAGAYREIRARRYRGAPAS